MLNRYCDKFTNILIFYAKTFALRYITFINQKHYSLDSPELSSINLKGDKFNAGAVNRH